MSNRFEKYLIVSDLDGTFFGETTKFLDNNFEAIRYFRDHGGVFTIATGRDYRVLKEIFPHAGEILSGPAILCNGVYLFDFEKERLMDEIALNKAEFLPLLQKITEAFPDVGYRISTHYGFLCPKITPFMAARMTTYRSLVIPSPIEPYMDIPWHKCVFVAEPETILEISAFVSKFPTNQVCGLPSFATLYELLPVGASKGAKIDRLKSYYPNRLAICVGDYTNDLDMLCAADIAACPDNAIDEVKAISKIHLCHHRDGCIADLIYKLDTSTNE